MDILIKREEKMKKENKRLSQKDINLFEGELVFAIVGRVGIKLQVVSDSLTDWLKEVNYNSVQITLSKLLDQINISAINDSQGGKTKDDNEYDRIKFYMDKGDELRKNAGNNAALSQLAINEIRKEREKETKDENKPNKKIAYILKSLKHPEEVSLLRRVYGDSFFLIGVYSSKTQCEKNLKRKIGEGMGSANYEDFAEKAKKLIDRDEKEKEEHGQRVSQTFHLSDVFITMEDGVEGSCSEQYKDDLRRFVELIFKNTFHTPTRDEYGMFFAYVAGLRSSALARQVGAAITTEKGEILSVGANDVPCFGGGLYWGKKNEEDHRDFGKGIDSNDQQVEEKEKEIIEALRKNEVIVKEESLKKILKNTSLEDITEFGRILHAEMDAITQAVRLGISIKGHVLYTTLFPCHNCTKHIVACGIERVVYIEPYPKSFAEEFHKDSISIEKKEKEKVFFQPFVGIGPRRYMDLFSMIGKKGFKIRRKEKDTGKVINWDKNNTEPRFSLDPNCYLDYEKYEVEAIIEIIS